MKGSSPLWNLKMRRNGCRCKSLTQSMPHLDYLRTYKLMSWR